MIGTVVDDAVASLRASVDVLLGADLTTLTSAASQRRDARGRLRLLRSGSLPDCGGVPVTITTSRRDFAKRDGLARTGHGDVVAADGVALPRQL